MKPTSILIIVTILLLSSCTTQSQVTSQSSCDSYCKIKGYVGGSCYDCSHLSGITAECRTELFNRDNTTDDICYTEEYKKSPNFKYSNKGCLCTTIEQGPTDTTCKKDSDCFLKKGLPYHINDPEHPTFQYSRHEAGIAAPIAYCNEGVCAIKFDCSRCDEFKEELDETCKCPPGKIDKDTGECTITFGTAQLRCATYLDCNC
jgi:hypothetical protein